MFQLEKIFNTLVLYHYNMRVLHWKVKGLAFDNKHELAKGYYDKFDDLIDEIAEILLMLGGSPKDLNSVVNTLNSDQGEGYLLITCEGETYYTETEMLASIQKMLEHLLSLYTVADKDESIPSDVRSKLEEHMYYFRLECDYKGKNRLIPN